MRRVILIALGAVLSILALPGRGWAELVTIDNKYVRLVIDESTGNITEVTWKGGSNRQLVNQSWTDRYKVGIFRLSDGWSGGGWHESGSVASSVFRGFNFYRVTFENADYGSKTLDIRWGKDGVYVGAEFDVNRSRLLIGCLWQPGGDRATDQAKVYPPSGQTEVKEIRYPNRYYSIYGGNPLALGVVDGSFDEVFGYRSKQKLRVKLGAGSHLDGPIVYLPEGHSEIEFALTSKENFDKFAAGKWSIAGGPAIAGGINTVTTVQGEKLIGKVLGIEAGGRLRLSGPQFEGEVQILASALERVSAMGGGGKPAGTDKVLLSNGDLIWGRITEITQEHVLLETGWTEPMKISRKVVRAVAFHGQAITANLLKKAGGDSPSPSHMVRFGNQDSITARVVSLAGGVFVAQTEYGRFELPVEKAEAVVFAGEGLETPKKQQGDVMVQTGRSKFTVQFEGLTEEHLLGRTEHLGKVKVRRTAIRSIRFNIHR